MTVEFIVNHIWQSSCFALAAGALAFMLRRYSPKVRYWVWLSASLKFLLPWTLLVSLGSAIPWRTTSVSPAPLPGPLIQLAEPFSTDYGAAVQTSTQSAWGITALALIWAVGLLWLVFLRCKSWNSVRDMLRAGTPVSLPISVPSLISPVAKEPGVVGFLRPVFVLPPQLLDRLSPAQLKALLAHEMCHVSRRDNLFAALHMAVESLFWFHPLVWWIGSRMLEEQELACDEEVLRMGHSSTDYIRGILAVCQHYSDTSLPCVAGVTGADIKIRLKTILSGNSAQELSRYKKAALALSAVAALVLPVGLGIWNAPQARAQAARKLEFDVASVRPAGGPTPGGPICGASLSPTAVVSGPEAVLAASGGTLVALVSYAYQDSVDGVDLPEWIRGGDRFAVSVRVPPNTNAGACREMLRTLLAERFHLVTGVETRQLSKFYLKVAKSGLKLKTSGESPDTSPVAMSTPIPGYIRFTYRAAPLSRILVNIGTYVVMEAQVSGLVNDPSFRVVSGTGVVDETGLTGTYDGTFDFYATRPVDDAPESLNDAITRQLGLTLELRKAPGRVLVIRSGDRMPTDN